MRAVLARARERLGAHGQRTILFLDEIHRFNKAQQDALLPAVEEGLVTLIGATTENPYFEVNSALLSRCRSTSSSRSPSEELAAIVRRGAAELGAELPTSSSGSIARRAGGDARTALNILELAAQTAAAEGVAVEDATSRTRRASGRSSTTRAATRTTTSSRPSSSRCAAPIRTPPSTTSRRCSRAARTPRFIARRMIVLASEDIGNADPRALLVAVAAAHAVEHVGLPEARLNLAQAAIYLARAPKSNAVLTALGEAATGRARARPRPPARRRCATRTTPARRSSVTGKGYVYPHDDPPASRSTTCRTS